MNRAAIHLSMQPTIEGLPVVEVDVNPGKVTARTLYAALMLEDSLVEQVAITCRFITYRYTRIVR